MNREIIKNKFGKESIWNQSVFEGFDKFIEDKTSLSGEGNDPWSYDIPLSELNINIPQVERPVFEYNNHRYLCQTIKAPLLRTCELDKNFTSLVDNSQIKKELEDFINNNFTHVYSVIEQRAASVIGYRRVMNEVVYIIRGVKI
jgi:hypothetical protein